MRPRRAAPGRAARRTRNTQPNEKETAMTTIDTIQPEAIDEPAPEVDDVEALDTDEDTSDLITLPWSVLCCGHHAATGAVA